MAQNEGLESELWEVGFSAKGFLVHSIKCVCDSQEN